MSNTRVIAKQEVLKLLSLSSVDDLNLALVECGQALEKEAKQPSEEFLDPEKFDGISREALQIFRDFLKQVGTQQAKALPGTAAMEPTETTLTPTQPTAIVGNVSYTEQVLESALETIQQLYANTAILEAVDLADLFWDTVDSTFTARTEERLEQTINNLTTRMELSFNRIQERSSTRTDTQTRQVGKLSEISGKAITRSQQLVEALTQARTTAKKEPS